MSPTGNVNKLWQIECLLGPIILILGKESHACKTEPKTFFLLYSKRALSWCWIWAEMSSCDRRNLSHTWNERWFIHGGNVGMSSLIHHMVSRKDEKSGQLFSETQNFFGSSLYGSFIPHHGDYIAVVANPRTECRQRLVRNSNPFWNVYRAHNLKGWLQKK